MIDDGRYYEVLVDMVDMVDGRYSTYGTAVWSIWLGGGGGCVGSGFQSETSVRLFPVASSQSFGADTQLHESEDLTPLSRCLVARHALRAGGCVS